MSIYGLQSGASVYAPKGTRPALAEPEHTTAGNVVVPVMREIVGHDGVEKIAHVVLTADEAETYAHALRMETAGSLYGRAAVVIDAIKRLRVGRVTQEQGEYIARLLRGDLGLFLELDERPGQFDPHYPETDWHWKLRQARNGCHRFFDVLNREA